MFSKYGYQLAGVPVDDKHWAPFFPITHHDLPLRFQFMLRGCNVRPLLVGCVLLFNYVIYLSIY